MSYLEIVKKVRNDESTLWQGDEYKIYFDEAVNSINSYWTSDLQEFMREQLPDLARLIEESESRINRLWGKASLSEYREELTHFRRLHEIVKVEYDKAS